MMHRRAKIIVLPMESLLAILRGEKRLANLPPDSILQGATARPREVHLQVQSMRWPEVPEWSRLPEVPAILQVSGAGA